MSEATRTGNGTVAVREIDQPLDYAVLEHVLGTGDLSKLTIAQRVAYYRQTCESLGLNWRTRPFRFMSFQGQVVMYATKDCADQLRSIRKISLAVVNQKLDGDLFIVTVRATAPDGRTDEDLGAVTMGRLQGDARANAILKGVTKAKRRVTLSICGLGFNDETEIETLSGAVTYEHDEEPPKQPPAKALAAPRPPTPNGGQTRSAASIVDAIEPRARTATTMGDLDSLERDDDVRAIRQHLPEGRPQRDRLETILAGERERITAFEQGAPPDDEDHIPDDFKPVDADALHADKVVTAINASPSMEAVDKGILGSVSHTSWINHLTASGRKDLITRLEDARKARQDALGA